jgi:LuxR family maltose regulon positive regulatory protein
VLDVVGDGRDAQAIRALVTTQLAAAALYAGDGDDARDAAGEAEGLAEACGAVETRVDALGLLALAESLRGRLKRGAAHASAALELAEGRGVDIGLTAAAQVALAWTAFQWLDGTAAARHAEAGLEAAGESGDRCLIVAATLAAAAVLAGQGPEGADRAVRRLRRRIAQLGDVSAPLLASLADGVEGRLLAASGDLAAAHALIERARASGRDSASLSVLEARLALAEGRPLDAARSLEELRTVPLIHSMRIERAVLAAVAYAELREREPSREALEEALLLAAPHAYRRPFLEGGPSVGELLRQHVRRGTAQRAFVTDLLSSFDGVAREVEVTRPQLLEPLSERERALLAYLPTMMSNTEIASELFVSVNTVKTHLRNVYRKLGVSRRRDAIDRARRLELL